MVRPCKSSLWAALLLGLTLVAFARAVVASGSNAVQFGNDIPAVVQRSVLGHLRHVNPLIYNTTAPAFSCRGFQVCLVR